MIGFATVLGCGVVGGFAGLMTYGIPLGIQRRQIARLRNLCRAQRTLVLTYDDGPGRDLTPAVMSALKAFDAPATFFLLGCRAAAAPQMVQRLADAGHELGCHGQNHPHAWRTAPWNVWTDVVAGYQTLQRWIEPTAVFRPPYGKTTLPVLWRLKRRHTPVCWWTIDSGDTHASLPTPDSVVEKVRRDGGGVVLLHDFDRDPASRDEQHAHVLRITESLLHLARAEGYRVRCLGELMCESDERRLRSSEDNPNPATRSAPRPLSSPPVGDAT